MNSQETVALSKAIATKTVKVARANLEPGEYLIDIAVQLQGLIKVAEDTEKTPTSSLLNKHTVATVLHMCGVTREAAMKAWAAISNEILAEWEGTEADREIAKARREQQAEELGLNDALAMFEEQLEELPKIPVKGRVTTKLSVNELDSTIEQDSDDLLEATGTEGR